MLITKKIKSFSHDKFNIIYIQVFFTWPSASLAKTTSFIWVQVQFLLESKCWKPVYKENFY